MPSSSYIELNVGDDLLTVIKKCNTNFKFFGTQKQRQDRLNMRDLEEEEEERKEEDERLDDRITEVENKIPKVFYGTCGTASTTQTKVVDCPDFTLEDLVAGCLLYCRFTYEQGYNGAPNLNVNSTGSQQVSRVSTEALPRYWWEAKEMVAFVYEGTRWLVLRGGIADTDHYGNTKLSSAIDSTSEAKAATSKAVKQAYDLANGKLDANLFHIGDSAPSPRSEEIFWYDTTDGTLSIWQLLGGTWQWVAL